MEYVKLGDLISLVIDYRGKTPLKLKGEWASEGYRALSALNVKTGGLVAEDKIRFVNEDLYHKWMKQEVNRGDILITSEAPFGQVLQWNSDEKIVLSQRLFAIRIKTDVDNRYVYYYMTSQPFQGELKARATGSTVEGLRQPALMKCRLSLPELPLQHRIASILSTYDTLIENNTKRIRLLEKMAENLYKEWFVRFRYPGHENVEMENGLPKGWTVEKVKDWCRVFTGRKDVNQTVEGGKYAFFSCSLNMFHSDEYIYDGKAVLIAGNGSYTGRTRYFEGKFDLYQRTYAVVSDRPDDDFMFYLFLRFKYDFEPLHNGGTRGSAIPYIVMKDITKYKFLYDTDIVKCYTERVKPMFDEIDNLQHQNSLLARQRDLLLPRLMSGKLEVKEELLE